MSLLVGGTKGDGDQAVVHVLVITGFITTLLVAGEVQVPLNTVKLYVPIANPVIVVEVPVPVLPPGFIVQVPAGKPLKSTLPVADIHVGWVVVPIIGVDGTRLSLNHDHFYLVLSLRPSGLASRRPYLNCSSPPRS